MIYITGDCHGEYRRFNRQVFPEQREMTRNDYVMVCGDFGYWDTSKEQEWWRYWLSQRSFTLLWVDGNHENYDMLAELPVEEWHGGNVQYIAPNVIHLMRGQVYEIEGLKFFTFGGARSHDIQDGILDPEAPDFKEKYRKLIKARALFRVKHLSWWEEEMPDEAEFEEGRKNLARNDWQVDFIVTHCTASSTQAMFGTGLFQPDKLTAYLEEIKQTCQYRKWFFGHYHDNRNVTEKDIMLYEQIIRIH
ncbi:MAG: metallophosphoesterase family protein [bacterium]|nr:metallophosphoesterase family protein [bacterium]